MTNSSNSRSLESRSFRSRGSRGGLNYRYIIAYRSIKSIFTFCEIYCYVSTNQIWQIYQIDMSHVMLLLCKLVESYPIHLHFLQLDFDLKMSLISRCEIYHIDHDLMITKNDHIWMITKNLHLLRSSRYRFAFSFCLSASRRHCSHFLASL